MKSAPVEDILFECMIDDCDKCSANQCHALTKANEPCKASIGLRPVGGPEVPKMCSSHRRMCFRDCKNITQKKIYEKRTNIILPRIVLDIRDPRPRSASQIDRPKKKQKL
eukprot:TRINITY_DN2795_c1_g1_i1.p1 TRINITY_DN2795_c1_g1~~TRINITY_DN2795_c1_g1_i1.p1  ORF type:complete len:110 (-),score=21.22 TRINITY_DN2795_c1_g1_i1:72-401(-)